MSEVITDLGDEFFEAYAQKIKKDNEKKPTTSYTPREYEEVGYTGLEKGRFKIYRLIGAPVGSEAVGYVRKNYDPLEVMIAEVKDDFGKPFTIKLPKREDSPQFNHILHRLYDKVNEFTYIDKKKVFINEKKYPELWNAVNHTGYKPEDKWFTFSSGLKAANYAVYNVIDRHDSWCKDNKHTKILCREVQVDDKGNTWPKHGIKSYGFIQRIQDLMDKYKNYEKYDVAIMRTGEKDNPMILKNASIYAEKDLMEELKNQDGSFVDKNIVKIGPLSDEEKSYERYDLDKFYQPTSYTKILKRIPSVFKLCDATLGTKFYDELEKLVEEEKAKWDEMYRNEETSQSKTENEAINEALEKDEPTTTARRKVVGPMDTGLSDEKIALLKGWAKLSDEEKSLIKDVIIKDGKIVEIEWTKDKKELNLLACDCGVASPESWDHCAVCGADFIDE